jgi:transposase
MFLKANKKTVNGKEYINYLLVESVSTPKGSRHHVVCSLGNLRPAPKEYWLQLVRKVESALVGQLPLVADMQVDEIVDRVREARLAPDEQSGDTSGGVTIDIDRVTVEEAREAGPVHVGHQIWQRIGINEVLVSAGFDERECALTEILTLNRLARPTSERGTKTWVSTTALPDILGQDLCALGDNTLYLHLDKLHAQRELIESQLAERETNLFNLDDSILLYDLTSTYFEGGCGKNKQAKYGYSRDGRSDCKQVVIGLVLNGDGFAKAHEVFDGNRVDTTTVADMLDSLDRRTKDAQPGRTVAVDRGMSSSANLSEITKRGYRYVVAAQHKERDALLAEFGDETSWGEVERSGKAGKIRIKRVPPDVVKALKTKAWEKKAARAKLVAERASLEKDPTKAQALKEKAEVAKQAEEEARLVLEREELYVLCLSTARIEKDKAIREKQENRLLADLAKLEKRVQSGNLKAPEKVVETIGRLKERYQRVARYYEISFDAQAGKLKWQENKLRKATAVALDGSYLLKTNRVDMSDQQIWQTYTLLTRVESAFRDMKSPLMERPIFHQLVHRVQAHIFVCVLAYHLLVAIEKQFRDRGHETSWETIREALRTHQVVTVVMPTTAGRTLRLRRATTAEEAHQDIYGVLSMTADVIAPVKTWASA